MSDADLLGCIDWIAHGFEIVQVDLSELVVHRRGCDGATACTAPI